MIDIGVFRENPDLIKDSQKKRQLSTDIVDEVIIIDKEYRKLQYNVQKHKHKRNVVNDEIIALKKQGKSAEDKITEMRKLSEEIKKFDDKIKELLEKRDAKRKEIPNLLDASVPKGFSEEDNKELRKWGTLPKFVFKPQAHADIVENMNLADVKRGSKTSGARFYYLRNELVLLNLALQKFTIDFLMKKGYQIIQPPYMLNRFSVGGAVSLSDFEESIYKIEEEDLYLIGTSEHALAAMHQDEMIDVKKPIKYAGISSCFRKEAGSHGKDTKGIFRVHRFEKIEQFVLCKPEDEQKMFDELINNQEELFKLLELPYRIVFLCTADTGGSMSKTHDLEAWFPAQDKYRELGSTSSARNYQANKLNIKYYKDKNEKAHVYTLNGTAMSIQRTMCCILENYQQKDGSIKIPKVLQSYMNGLTEIKTVEK